jgi:SNF2 family DNA or RNA helicase
MAKLENIKVNSIVRGLVADSAVTVKHVKLLGDNVLEVTFVDAEGNPNHQLVFRDQEAQLEIVHQTRPFSFSADPNLFKLVSEAQRIRLGYLFDPLTAINTSSVDPLPHQITAVYQVMLNRQPLRFLLADDPGAGKTIMTGLLIKELIIRGDVAKCLIVAPGSLVEQWQDELDQKFNLNFDVLTNDAIQSSRTGNWFQEHQLCLARLDKLSRNDDLKAQLETVDWDLVVVDEAHKMSAHYFNNEVQYTKRFRLGQLLSSRTRQLLLLTATPHNGKDEDFQLFLSLLDGDRFEGKYRDGVHSQDTNDLMRRLVKEKLVTMEGKPLFPERFAYTIQYTLSDDESALYELVTQYVRDEFNRADNLEKGRKGTVGFALTILQRRLASSPEAIYQSLRRRRERLERRLRDERMLKRGAEVRLSDVPNIRSLDEEDLEDLDDAPETEAEMVEQDVIDLATASLTIAELEAEISTLKRLEAAALTVRRSGKDTKWRRLSETLQENPEMFDSKGNRRKLVIFTEQRDTLHYLRENLVKQLGREEAVVYISGQTPRDKRRQIQEAFLHDPEVMVLVATDAAGEGINLQRAHLMVNYDLPWNPNRLEQRFGRIHRIGQKDVCHLWNIVAQGTCEGAVFLRLLTKLAKEKEALGGAVFDVLGSVFQDRPLKDLLVEAIRKGETPEARAWLDTVIDTEMSSEKIRSLIQQRSLTDDSLPSSKVQEIRDFMAKAEARKLQPHYIGAFFQEAFAHLGGKLSPREPQRFEIRYVPSSIRLIDRNIGGRAPVLKSYERVTFLKQSVHHESPPPAALLAPGHPLLDSTIDLILKNYRELMRQGSILVDPADDGVEPRLLYFIDHVITDGRKIANRESLAISRRLLFIELDSTGNATVAGYAPYLDYEPLQEEQKPLAERLIHEPWLSDALEDRAIAFAVESVVPEHLQEVRLRRDSIIQKTEQEVMTRLTREIGFWNQRARELEAQESAGKSRSKLNSGNARTRAEALSERLQKRMDDLKKERQIVARPPTILGGALVIPAGFFKTAKPGTEPKQPLQACTPPPLFGGQNRSEVERLAMTAVMERERELGHTPKDVSSKNRGYDIESHDADSGILRLLEVKGRAAGADTVTVTKNEILTALNKPEGYYLVLVEISGPETSEPIYIKTPFEQEPDFATASVNFKINELKTKATI